MKPIIKWAGGKTSEIDKIKALMPSVIERYVEPFLGGGALYFHLEKEDSLVNDFNSELVNFYKMVGSDSFDIFNHKLREYDELRKKVNQFDFTGMTNEDVKDNFINFYQHPDFNSLLEKELLSKSKSRLKLEKKLEKSLTADNVNDLYKTAILAALYYCNRKDYNAKNKDGSIHLFNWFIMRELGYSGMFRYSKNGDFNVPYGGMSYNSKDLLSKSNYMLVLNKNVFYRSTEFNNLDFEMFFEKYDYFSKNDFIFIDPPYDSEFSQYNKETDFEKEDQVRLRDLLMKTKANIMIVIKETDFIKSLYEKDFYINQFEKNYSVNFKNRNSRNVNHLVITNYKV